MKKFISMILVLSMMFMFTLPALAEEAGVDKQLEAVTLKVKNLLDVKDSYTDFSGELNDTGTHSLWSLSWTGDGENLNVCASETGKIASFNYYSDSGSSEPYSGSLLKFPEFTKEQAEKIAADVLSRILDAKTESVSFDGSGEPLRLLRSKGDDYYLNGSLLINSVKTPVRVSLTIDFNTHTVKSFYRSDDAQDYGGFKTPDKAVPSSSASKTLFSTVKMKLAYARRGGDDKTAYLQYTPVNDAEYVVDAFTGSLVNLTELAGYNGGGYASAGEAKTASDAADNGKKHLTDA
ncbi:MAG: hypothetical protein Q8878_07245, partial [Bacillota bacterium]|nr:hypothetical protein [Bacillota bacterium]